MIRLGPRPLMGDRGLRPPLLTFSDVGRARPDARGEGQRGHRAPGLGAGRRAARLRASRLRGRRVGAWRRSGARGFKVLLKLEFRRPFLLQQYGLAPDPPAHGPTHTESSRSFFSSLRPPESLPASTLATVRNLSCARAEDMIVNSQLTVANVVPEARACCSWSIHGRSESDSSLWKAALCDRSAG